MGINWTPEQQKVIDLRKRNVLVSAAAGSGKTAVLVERIISMVLDQHNPIDIDRLLIVTFTRAAAGEMRQRIAQALETRLAEDPDNEHLQRQTTLIHRAQISTIHGFCSSVIHNYFHLIDLDPGFRMADEGELKLLKSDVVADVLEEAYQKREQDFLEFVECFSTGKSDEGIGEMILQLYEFSDSDPWPQEWLERCKDNYKIESWEQLEQTPWMQYLWKDIQSTLQDALSMTKDNLAWTRVEGGPYMYEKAIEADLAVLEYVCQAESYKQVGQRIRTVSWDRLAGKKDETVQEAIKQLVKDSRERVKDMIQELNKQYFFASPKAMETAHRKCGVPLCQLIDLTNEFRKKFSQKKREKNLLDFSDLEHLALQILVTREDQVNHMTEAAAELSQQYQEILIDEYQDSNLVQEVLLTMVSAAIRGEYNLFMVGDVKQSIYRFRQARPELFMEKLESYSVEDSDRQRVDLHKNFRSRPEVLRTVNFFFQQIMRREVGGVEYDKDAALYTGAVFEEGNDPDFAQAEIMVIDGSLEVETDTVPLENKVMEARAIGNRIKEMVGQELVWDGKLKKYRPMAYGDCVILLRTLAGWAEEFNQVLSDMGIPAYSTSKTGYFSAMEVQNVLNYLRICDNPLQDIPFTAVLSSPFAECTPEDLAWIRCVDKEIHMYDCARIYAAEGENQQLRDRLAQFFVLYDDICARAVYTPIHQLIWYLMEHSGYSTYVWAMPGGQQRIANVRMLVEKAMDYENTSYRGLFNFIRYMEHLQKYNVDYGEVNIVGENDNTVRIMSIHKSKGLEFPVVFVAGLGKRFNQQDFNKSVIVDADFGVGANYVDYVNRVKSSTLMRATLRRKGIVENLGEELRVLYVAMSRAKEKLILCGCLNKYEEKISQYHYLLTREEAKLPTSMLSGATSYWGWILPALVRAKDRAPITVQVITPEDLVMWEMGDQTARILEKEDLLNWDRAKVYDPKIKEVLEKRFSYEYPYENMDHIPVKISVSELKKQSMEEEETAFWYPEPDVMPLIPQFMKETEEELGGAGRGTVYHRVMELLNLEQANTREQIAQQIQSFVETGKLEEKEAQCIKMSDIETFVHSELGQQMCLAQMEGRLYREQPFVMGVEAQELQEQWPKEEMVLVQGIIDAFYYEGEGIVLADYKTDRVGAGGGKELADKYKVQLASYARALEQLTGKPVLRQMIYSFTLGETIVL